MNSLYIVVPCYNEQEVLHETTKRLINKIERMVADGLISQDSRIMYVDDGSKDSTWAVIEELHAADARVLGVKLSRNRGHQNA
ncbi:MAG: glycosyltransferase, partial [Christensenella sp.]